MWRRATTGGEFRLERCEIEQHNAEVSALWADYGRRANARVPIVFASDDALWLKLTGQSFARFYEDPRVQLQVQLEGPAWFSENVVHDRPFGPPADTWSVAARFWMDDSDFFGCEVTLQEDTYAWSKPLSGSKQDLLQRLAGIDPSQRVKQTRLWSLHQAMGEMCEGMIWRDLPVQVIFPGGGTHGVFTTACHVRGVEALCLDLVEDPDFAAEFLGLITEKLIAKIGAWHELAGTGTTLPGPGGWGMPDDSIQLLSADTYRRAILPHHERIYSAMTTGPRSMHLCGHATQHYRTLYDSLGIVSLDGPGPFADHGALLADMPSLSLSAQVDHTVLLLGPPSAIDDMLRAELTTEAKQPGRYSLLGYAGPATPLSHLQAMYEAGKRYGSIQL
jgi:hypothetical protein